MKIDKMTYRRLNLKNADYMAWKIIVFFNIVIDFVVGTGIETEQIRF